MLILKIKKIEKAVLYAPTRARKVKEGRHYTKFGNHCIKTHRMAKNIFPNL
jgi:hypothetical protein